MSATARNQWDFLVKFRSSVLVVDPDPVGGLTVTGMLGRDGIDGVAVSGTEGAAAAIRSQRFDVILLDIEHLEWSRTFEAIRALEPTADVVVATAFTEDAVQALRAGAVDVIAKPYAFDDLRLRVALAAERHTTRLKLAAYEASQVLHSARSQEALFGWLAEAAHQVLGADEVGVLTRADATQPFEVLKGTSFPEAVLRWLADLAGGDGRGRIWPSPSDRPLAATTLSLTSSLALPLTMGDEVLGMLVAMRKPGAPAFTPSELHRGGVLASQLALAMEHARLFGELRSRLSEIGATRERLIHVEKLGLANELAASVAHEVNNPLTFVQMNFGELKAMDLRTAPADEIHTLIDETSEGISRIAELVSGFGRLALPSPVKPPRRIEAATLAQTIAVRHNAAFRAHARARSFAFVDPQTVEAGVDAILTFLSKQTRERTTPIVVEVTAVDRRASIAVSDDSLVLSDSERLRIFDPRVGVDTTGGRTMRLDLDLPLAYQALRANGVDVSVTGSDERGVRIELLLPELPEA
jgi:DNA-binding response OmpR family regulator